MTMSIKLLHLKVSDYISYWFRIMVSLLYKYFFCGLYCIQLILFINQVQINTTLTLFHSYFNLILNMSGQLKPILNLLSI